MGDGSGVGVLLGEGVFVNVGDGKTVAVVVGAIITPVEVIVSTWVFETSDPQPSSQTIRNKQIMKNEYFFFMDCSPLE